MGTRNDHQEWGRDRATVRQLFAAGRDFAAIHAALPHRTAPAIRSLLRREGLRFSVRDIPRPKARPAAPSPDRVQEVTGRVNEDGSQDHRADGRKIKTVDDLLRHVEADMTRFEIAASEVSKYEGQARDASGKVKVTEMFRVWVRLKPKAGPSVAECVKAIVDGAVRARPIRSLRIIRHHRDPQPILQSLVIADPHFGKYAWAKSTGGDSYDLTIASTLLRQATQYLIGHGDTQRPKERHIYLLGDIFHYDTPSGTTTGGTPLERDGRIQKMLKDGADAIFAAIDLSARTCPTRVVLVDGNHDSAMSWALQLMLTKFYDGHPSVRVDDTYTRRKYVTWGGNLIGLTHGDEAAKALPQLMALEVPQLWGAAKYREIHKGHLHIKQSALQTVDTVDGVLVRTATALCPPDDWHSKKGFLGGQRAMETYFYHESGGPAGSKVWAPDYV